MAVFTVSDIARYLKNSLERDPVLGDLWVSGEVSNLRTYPSGHTYFTLKDGQCQIRSVMFKGGRGAELLSDGGLVTGHGRVSFYENRGEVQFISDLVMPEGIGPLFLELARLRMRLEEEGLFQESRKRSLPAFPQIIGLVTSPAGAVLHDVRTVLGRRYPLAELLLAPTRVQGDGAAEEIVAAIQELNDDGRADVIIVARGGGSIEELWAFNEEIVARAIYASRIPVVSAVGHDRDHTIADDVADLSAPTPSAAAELVAPDRRTLAQEVGALSQTLESALSGHLSVLRFNVNGVAARLMARAPDVDTLRRRVDDLASAAGRAITHQLVLSAKDVATLEARLRALEPAAILYRGYAIVQKTSDGSVVSRTGQVATGDSLGITVGDGEFPATTGATQAPRPRHRRERPAPAGAALF